MTDAPDPPGGPRPRLFIIDADYAVIELLRQRLDRHYVVGGTTDAANAVVLAADAGPDLILCDLHLPGTSGDRLARDLAGQEATASVPVVFLTGLLSAGDTTLELGGRYGGRLAVSKRASLAALLKTLRQVRPG